MGNGTAASVDTFVMALRLAAVIHFDRAVEFQAKFQFKPASSAGAMPARGGWRGMHGRSLAKVRYSKWYLMMMMHDLHYSHLIAAQSK